MKTKRFLCLFLAVILSLSSFAAFAEDEITEEILIAPSPEEEYVGYSTMYNWAYWNHGEEKPEDYNGSGSAGAVPGPDGLLPAPGRYNI